MNWKKLIIILFGVPLLLGLLAIFALISYTYLDSIGILDGYDNYLFRKKLTQALNKGDKVIQIKDITNFEWDKVCAYTPYTWKHSEAYEWSLVFENGGRVVHEFPVPERLSFELYEHNCEGIKAKFYILCDSSLKQNKCYIKLTESEY
ncbi:hypothetical protein NF27_JC00060 [Candidatus Jidaibacter acanthamoeba]|uniref:Uncharacterized protein n=1 Tax=Candidatus Jidaibacter acanthamoebae TaxID=86105 RepID=A0A0C1QF66_9RICK|nr:hypothetical protein [Candidatus Jidaibacter acanthamoeba]KIE04199.1 hypothetical protein NF27_JC00060 [Candidatus Jidaibacter acanthamoeba]